MTQGCLIRSMDSVIDCQQRDVAAGVQGSADSQRMHLSERPANYDAQKTAKLDLRVDSRQAAKG